MPLPPSPPSWPPDDEGGGVVAIQKYLVGFVSRVGPQAGILQFDELNYDADGAGDTVTVTVNRVSGTSGVATVNYATTDGTAVDGTNYTGASGALSWSDAEGGAKTFDITILDDGIITAPKTLVVDLSAATGGDINADRSVAVITITDTAIPTFFSFEAATYSYPEDYGTITIPVTRTGDISVAHTVNVIVTGDTAIVDTDYTGSGEQALPDSGGSGDQVLSWAANESGSKSASYDLIYRYNETQGDKTLRLGLQLTGNNQYGPITETVVTIVDITTPSLWPTQGAVTGLPIYPEARGWGITTIAGSGRQSSGTPTRRIVTSLDASGAGTLDAAIAAHNGASGPSVIGFEVSGEIQLDGELSITRGLLTIAGETAPAPGITLRGCRLNLSSCPDTLISHLRIAQGDADTGVAYDNRSCVAVDGASATRIVFANCEFWWAVDRLVRITNCPLNITFFRCLFAETLIRSWHSYGQYGGALRIDNANKDAKVSIVQSAFIHAGYLDEAPLCRTRYVGIYNCAFLGQAQSRYVFLLFSSVGGYARYAELVGNAYLKPAVSPVAWLGFSGTDSSAKVYAPIAQQSFGSGMSTSIQYLGGANSSPLSATPVSGVAPEGLILATATDVVAAIVSSAGCRPNNRSEWGGNAARVLGYLTAAVENPGTTSTALVGQQIDYLERPNTTDWPSGLIESPANDWPTMTSDTSTWTDPSSPDSVTESGYTNRELALNILRSTV